MEVAKNNDMSRDLVPFREPADINKQIILAKQKLNELKTLVVDTCKKKSVNNVSIEENTIDEIISSFEQMNNERLWLLEAVEEETIRASVYRHKLEEFPRDIEGEIKDAVRSARDSNKARIKALKDELNQIQNDIVNLKKQNEELVSSNAALEPEQSDLQTVHKKYIDELNEALLSKANMQITLNETREQIRETTAKTEDLRKACNEMKTDIAAEVEDAIAEEKRLSQEIVVTMKKVEDQQGRNLQKKQEVIAQDDRCHAAEKALQSKRDLITHHEQTCARLRELCDQRREQLVKGEIENQNKTKICEQLKKNTEELIETRAKELEVFQKNMQTLLLEINEAQKEHDLLQSQKIRATNLLDTALLSGRKDKDEADEMQKSLRVVKDDLLQQSSECSRLKRENIDLENQIQKVVEDHIGTADVLKKQIETIGNHLDDERKERQKLQKKRDELHKEMSDYISEFNKFSSITTRAINDGRSQHASLSEQGTNLQEQCKQMEKVVREKQKELQQAKTNYIALQKESKSSETLLLESIETLSKEIDKQTEIHKKELPEFEELKETFQRKTDEFEKMKKLIVEIKTMKADLEAKVEDKHTKLVVMDGPKAKLESELENTRALYLAQLKEQSQEIIAIEKHIFDTSSKYKLVKEQNERFKEAIKYFKSDVDVMRLRMHKMQDEKQNIEHTISDYRDWLELQWRKHMELDKQYYNEDSLLLNDIKKVAEITSEREKKVEGIHKQLEDQLSQLSSFLDNAVRLKTPPPPSLSGNKQLEG